MVQFCSRRTTDFDTETFNQLKKSVIKVLCEFDELEMKKSQVLGAFIASRFYDKTTWLPSSNHFGDETRGGV